MTANDRVRELRKHLNLTQVEFSDRMRISQGHLTSVETGARAVTAKFIRMLHLEFGVREEWVEFGTGDMFEDNSNDFIEELAAKYQLDDFQKNITRIFYELPHEYQDKILDYAQYLLSKSESEEAESDEERTIRIVRAARADADAAETDQDVDKRA